jgi:alkanesulfonate monooxygenase SsuD/methylene tetrahydromethanopterin reductase-like flavin-dependent oxidoreductase (luciferase family)
VRHKCEVLKRHCRDVGRDYDEIIKSVSFEPVIIAEDDREVRRLAERAMPPRLSSVDEWAQSALIGTPEQCIERIKVYENLGIRYFICYFLGAADDPAAMRLFARQVLPAFR